MGGRRAGIAGHGGRRRRPVLRGRRAAVRSARSRRWHRRRRRRLRTLGQPGRCWWCSSWPGGNNRAVDVTVVPAGDGRYRDLRPPGARRPRCRPLGRQVGAPSRPGPAGGARHGGAGGGRVPSAGPLPLRDAARWWAGAPEGGGDGRGFLGRLCDRLSPPTDDHDTRRRWWARRGCQFRHRRRRWSPSTLRRPAWPGGTGWGCSAVGTTSHRRRGSACSACRAGDPATRRVLGASRAALAGCSCGSPTCSATCPRDRRGRRVPRAR